MILKNFCVAIFCLCFLNGCIQNSAFLAPAYTLGTSGNVYQAGLSFTGNQAITSLTGKTPSENIKDFLKPDTKDSEFEKIVKRRVKITGSKINFFSQFINKMSNSSCLVSLHHNS